MFFRQLAKVLPRVDAGVVTIGEADAEGVVADEFNAERAERAGIFRVRSRQNRQRVLRHLLAQMFRLR